MEDLFQAAACTVELLAPAAIRERTGVAVGSGSAVVRVVSTLGEVQATPAFTNHLYRKVVRSAGRNRPILNLDATLRIVARSWCLLSARNKWKAKKVVAATLGTKVLSYLWRFTPLAFYTAASRNGASKTSARTRNTNASPASIDASEQVESSSMAPKSKASAKPKNNNTVKDMRTLAIPGNSSEARRTSPGNAISQSASGQQLVARKSNGLV